MRDVGLLQGFSMGQLDILEGAIARGVVTERQVLKMFGNSFSVNVVERVMSRALVAAGLAKKLYDKYEDAWVYPVLAPEEWQA